MKTEAVLFTKVCISGITLFSKELQITGSVKYLGVVIESGLTWNKHIERVAQRTNTSLSACRRAFGHTWGLKPHIIH